MLDRLSIRNDHESDCVRYELTDETGIVVETGSIPINEFSSIRNKIIADLAAKDDTSLDMLDYLTILFIVLETAL